MTILDNILENKRREVAENKELYPVRLLEKSIYFESPCVSMKHYITRPDKVGVIAEIKRKSPSRGDIHPFVSIERTSIGYMQAGASAISVLTDRKFFNGTPEDLTLVRKLNYGPVLRKDFIVDEYQIVEARSIGADAILLIAAALAPDELHRLAVFAKSLGLEVLMEVHNQEELRNHLNDHVDMVGVNNRNLKDNAINLDTSVQLADRIPAGFVKIAESGIHSPEDAFRLSQAGFEGFLIGTYFMKTPFPHKTCAKFIRKFKQLKEGR